LLDIELALPIAFVLLGAAGLVYPVLAACFYFRFERSTADMHVPVAFFALSMFYVLTFGCQLYVRGEALLPFLLLFGMPQILALVIWLGSQARSRAGTRVAMAGVFTLAAFVCWVGYAIYHSTKVSWR
jgi:hypothetical protein